MMDFILREPSWLVGWVFTLVIFNTASILFIRRVEARWVLAAWLVAIVLMNVLFAQFGYVRLLGLGHIIPWTPLIIYLWARRAHWYLESLSGKWIAGVFTVNLISLIIDYVDVIRWLLGERAPMA